jgi:hypothetical protein
VCLLLYPILTLLHGHPPKVSLTMMLQLTGPTSLTPNVLSQLQQADPLRQPNAQAALPQIALLNNAGQAISDSFFANSDFFGAKGFQRNVTPAALGMAPLAQGSPLDQLVSGNPIPRFASANTIAGATFDTFNAINNLQFGTGFNVSFDTSSAFPLVPAGPQSTANLSALQALAIPSLAPINITNNVGQATAIPFTVPPGLPLGFTVLREDPTPPLATPVLNSGNPINRFNPSLGFVPVTPSGVNGIGASIAQGLLPGQVPLQGGLQVAITNPFVQGATGGIQVPLSPNLISSQVLNGQANTTVTLFPLGGVPQVNPFPFGANPTATTVLASTTNFIDQLLFRPTTFVPGQGATVVANPFGGVTLLDPNDPMSAGTSLFYPTGFNPILATGVPLSANFDPNFGFAVRA